jgi:LuxR family maltose regulon positive regulatory protein
LIESSAQMIRIWDSGEVSTILKWTQALPIEVIRYHPWLMLFRSRSLFYAGKTDEAEAVLADTEREIALKSGMIANHQVLSGMVLSHRARYASVRGQIQAARDLSRQALAILPETENDARAFVLPTLALSAYLSGDVTEAAHHFQETIQISGRTSSRFTLIGNLTNLAVTYLAQGKLTEAVRIATEAVQAGTIHAVLLPVTGWPRFPLAEALYERNDLDDAERVLIEGLRLVREGHLTDYFGLMPALLARIHFALGRMEDAEATIKAALASARQTTVDLYIREIEAYQARLWLKQGKLEPALLWADDFQARPKNELLCEIENICLAEVLLDTGKVEKATILLRKLGEDAQAQGRFGREAAIRAMLAVACWIAKDMYGARQNIERALTLANPEGAMRPFLDLGEPMANLLHHLMRDRESEKLRSEHSNYLDQILDRLSPRMNKKAALQGKNSPGIDPLTPREMDVLHLLAEGLTNREIAGRLFVSPNTMRVYTTNLYSKLDVHTRAQAVRRAQELKLI